MTQNIELHFQLEKKKKETPKCTTMVQTSCAPAKRPRATAAAEVLIPKKKNPQNQTTTTTTSNHVPNCKCNKQEEEDAGRIDEQLELQRICEDLEEREERYKTCAEEDEVGRAAAVKGGGGLPGHVRGGDRAGIAAVATATGGWAVRGLPPSCFASSVWASRVSPRSLVSVSTYLLATYLSPPPMIGTYSPPPS